MKSINYGPLTASKMTIVVWEREKEGEDEERDTAY